MPGRKAWIAILAVALVSAAAGTAVSQYTHLGSLIRAWTTFLAPIQMSRDIVVVVDGHDGDKVKPDREVFAKLIRHFERCGAGAVAVDIYMGSDEKGPEFEKQTRELESAIAAAKIPLGLIFGHDEEELDTKDGIVTGPLYDPEIFGDAEYPPSVFPVAGVGVHLEGGPIGSLAVGVKDPERGFVPGLAVWSFSQLSGTQAWKSAEQGTVDLGGSAIRIFEGEIPIYYPPESEPSIYGYGKALSLDKEFRNKLVILGLRDDDHEAAIGRRYGAELNAYGTNWLLQQKHHGAFLILGPFWASVWGLILSVVSALLCFRSPFPKSAIGLFALSAFALASPLLLGKFRVIGVDWLGPLLAIVCTSILGLGMRTRTALAPVHEGTFPATCLFVDIKGSLALGERLGSHDSAEFKRLVLNLLGAVVHRNHGVVESPLGDGLYCVFTARSPALACSNALKAAIESVHLDPKATSQIRDEFGVIPEVRATVESGRLTMSTLKLGADRPSTSGRPADFASRLQGVAKQLGKRILVGPEAYALALTIAQWSDKLSKIADVPIEGSAETVSVYSPTEEG